MPLTRRHMLGLSLAATAGAFAPPAFAQRFVNLSGLGPGQFIWEPVRPATGAVLILVSRLEKLVHVYKDGALIGISTCETGDPQRTPMGIFILSDREDAESGPELAWTATALHAVNLNARSPDSIRIPTAFAGLLRTVALPGSMLIITDRHTEPNLAAQAHDLLPIELGNESLRRSRLMPRSFDLTSRDDTIAVVVSRADRQATVLRNGIVERHVGITIKQPNVPLGTHAYALLGTDENGQTIRWLGFGLGRNNREPHIASWQGSSAIQRVSLQDDQAASEIASLLHTGTPLIITDAAAGEDWRSASRDTVVLAAAEPVVSQIRIRGTDHADGPKNHPNALAKAARESGN